MKYVMFLFVLLMSCLTMSAQGLSDECALRLSLDFIKKKSLEGRVSKSKSFSRAEDLVILKSSDNLAMVKSNQEDFFVLVCGNDNNANVAGWGTCSAGEMPAALYNILRVKQSPVSSVNRNVEWAMADGFSLPISPLVSSVRHQSAPYNMLCPYYIYDDGAVSLERCLVGCVATATEQVVSHYKYPQYLNDTIAGFRSDNNGEIVTIKADTKIDFDNILDQYVDGYYSDVEAKAVAELSYYLGVACRMDWGVGSSGAKLKRLVEPLRRAFGYKYVRCINQCDYSPRRWFDLLLNELSAERPIVYAGYTTSGGGHAFVVDGIDADGYFHITWGYGGQYDGYFDLSVLTPQEHPLEPTFEGTVFGLNHLQQALFLNPDSVEYVTDDTLAVEHRVDIDTIVFNREPDTNMYMGAYIDISNKSDVDVWCPIELFTYTETDTLGLPVDIDYLGLADGMVAAGHDTTFVAYLQFSEVGERKLGVNMIDSMYLPFDIVNVKKAYQPALAIELNETEITDTCATFRLNINNTSSLYWSGRRLTYSIFEGDFTVEEGDWRHFTVLNLPPKENFEDEVSFGHLKPNTDYTFVVRNPWNPVLQYFFSTGDYMGLDDVVHNLPNVALRKDFILNHRIVIKYDESTGRYRQILRNRR